MTRIQQVHWELTMDYLGHPYYVPGTVIYNVLGMQLENNVYQHINASHGLFVPGQFGTFPDDHSQNGLRPYMGSSLSDVDSSEDRFLFRHSDQPWLLASHPPDALNARHPGPERAARIGARDDHRAARRLSKTAANYPLVRQRLPARR